MAVLRKRVDMITRKRRNVCSISWFLLVANFGVVDRDVQGTEGFFTDAKCVGRSAWEFVVSPDGLELLFTGSCGGDGGPQFGWDICTATRTSTDEPFGPPELVQNVSSPAEDEVGTLSFDGTTLLFKSTRAGGQGRGDLWIATRTNTESPFQNVQNLGPGVNTGDWDESPSLSKDELTLYFARLETGDLFMATRTTTDELFGNVVPLNTINLPAELEYSPSI
jgi:hypothetical protein